MVSDGLALLAVIDNYGVVCKAYAHVGSRSWFGVVGKDGCATNNNACHTGKVAIFSYNNL